MWQRSCVTTKNPTMDTLFQKDSPQLLTLANAGWNSSQPQVTTQHWCLWPQQYQHMTRPVRFIVDGLKKKLLVFPIWSCHTQAARIMPAASLQLLLTVLKEGETEDIREETPRFPSPSCPCLCVYVCPLEQREKRSSLYPRDKILFPSKQQQND